MTAVLQWAAFIALLAGTAWRVPTLARGRNRSLFWIFAVSSLCIGLSIPAIYLPVDRLLGGVNLANVALRLGLFSVFYMLASKVSAAYRSPRARTLVRGPLGLTVLAVSSAGIWVTFFLSDLPSSSTGLADFGGQPSVVVYAAFGRLYLAYASLCMAVPTGRAALFRRRGLDRGAALSLCIGFSMVFLASAAGVLARQAGTLVSVLSYASILFIVGGLVLIWVAMLRPSVTV